MPVPVTPHPVCFSTYALVHWKQRGCRIPILEERRPAGLPHKAVSEIHPYCPAMWVYTSLLPNCVQLPLATKESKKPFPDLMTQK